MSASKAREQYFHSTKKMRNYIPNRSISTAESNSAITNLETLAVVWAVTHFRYYLYGHIVVVITDHVAVKAILGAPNLTGQHASWWSKWE